MNIMVMSAMYSLRNNEYSDVVYTVQTGESRVYNSILCGSIVSLYSRGIMSIVYTLYSPGNHEYSIEY
jgi:hypothetical protein